MEHRITQLNLKVGLQISRKTKLRFLNIEIEKMGTKIIILVFVVMVNTYIALSTLLKFY